MPSTFGQQAAEKEFARTGARRAAKSRVLRQAQERRCRGTAEPRTAGRLRTPSLTHKGVKLLFNGGFRKWHVAQAFRGTGGTGRPCCAVKWHPKQFCSHRVPRGGTNLNRNKLEMQPAPAEDGQGVKLKLGSLFSLAGPEIRGPSDSAESSRLPCLSGADFIPVTDSQCWKLSRVTLPPQKKLINGQRDKRHLKETRGPNTI